MEVHLVLPLAISVFVLRICQSCQRSWELKGGVTSCPNMTAHPQIASSCMYLTRTCMYSAAICCPHPSFRLWLLFIPLQTTYCPCCLECCLACLLPLAMQLFRGLFLRCSVPAKNSTSCLQVPPHLAFHLCASLPLFFTYVSYKLQFS